MSDVFYHKGFTCECDAVARRLTIEGRRVPVRIADGLFESSELPGERTQTLRDLAKRFVEQSQEFKSREVTKRDHLTILKKGKDAWNDWRSKHPEIRPVLYDEDLSSETFKVDFTGANFANAVLINVNLRNATLIGANFHEANLGKADLSWADLTGANFCRTDLYGTNLYHADLTDANLQGTQLAGTIFEEATLKNCAIYGLSAWDLRLDGAHQENLRVLYRKEETPLSPPEEGEIIVPDLQLAQFIYLLLHNKAIHDSINTLTSKVVLLLGRFGGGGLEILRQLREGLQENGYVPVIFEFARPDDRTYTETVQTLAGLARFVVVDLSGPSVPQELYSTIPHLKIAFVPILERGRHPHSTFPDLLEYEWVLKPIFEFDVAADLLRELRGRIVDPAERWVEARRAKLKELYA